MKSSTKAMGLMLALCVEPRLAFAQGMAGGFDKTIRSRGPTGKPCLMPRSMTRSNPIVPNSFQHLVSIENTCSRSITIRICYKGSESCKQVAIRGYATETVFLGEMTGVPQFDFGFQEKAQR